MLAYAQTQISSKKASDYEFSDSCLSILEDAENAERTLAFGTGKSCTRHNTGSYYTPCDVVHFFWNEFFELNNLNDKTSATKFCQYRQFIEPSVGSGTLFFGLLFELSKRGVPLDALFQINIKLVDINAAALDFIRSKLVTLETAYARKFENVEFIEGNFLKLNLLPNIRPFCIFGNPPFVSNKKGTSRWKNSYADFLEKSLETVGLDGEVQFIVPLSLTFSRDYGKLRNMFLSQEREITLSNFDNIPDCLFKAGKTETKNTNKANSQRCSILTLSTRTQNSVKSSRLIRWSKSERTAVLSNSPEYLDVTDYVFNDQIPRPYCDTITEYLNQSHDQFGLEQYMTVGGKFELHIAGVSRNYISFRPEAGPSTLSFTFDDEHSFFFTFAILASDFFYQYWLSLGDGFHVTKSNVLSFPINHELAEAASSLIPTAKAIWANKTSFEKMKLNSGKKIKSYDFSGELRMTHLLRHYKKQVVL